MNSAFAATVLSLAGVEIPEYIEGKSFLLAKEEKKYVFGACDGVDTNVETSRSVTDGRYIYTRVFTNYQPFVRWIGYYDVSEIQHQMRFDYEYGRMNSVQREIMEPRTVEYLYDLKQDKWETHNLVLSSEYQEIVHKFRSELKQHLIETRDANFIPEYTLAKEEKNMLPYYFRLDDERYPIEQVIETAMLSGMGESVIVQQIEALQSDNEIVSYWAAVGLFAHRELLKPYLKQLEDLLPALSYPPTQIWLASAILDNIKSDAAHHILETNLTSGDKYLATYALNMLTVINMKMAKTFIPFLAETEKIHGRTDMLNVVRLRLQNKEFCYEMYW